MTYLVLQKPQRLQNPLRLQNSGSTRPAASGLADKPIEPEGSRLARLITRLKKTRRLLTTTETLAKSKSLIIYIPSFVAVCFSAFVVAFVVTHSATASEKALPTQISAVTANSLGDLFISIRSAAGEQQSGNTVGSASMSQVGTIHQSLLHEARLAHLGSRGDNSDSQKQTEQNAVLVELSADTAQLLTPANETSQSSVLFTGNSHASALRFMPIASPFSPSTPLQSNGFKHSSKNTANYHGALYIAANEFPIWKPQATDSADSYAKVDNAGLTNLHRLTLNNVEGQWQINEEYSMELDLAPIDGLFNVSELLTSPWETLLAVESIAIEATDVWNAPQAAVERHKLAHIRASAESVNQYLNRDSNPYRYGYIVELIDQPLGNSEGDSAYANGENKTPDIQRHYATGRMPAGKTLLSRDGKTLYRVAVKSGILFRFLSDYPNNLAAGTLSVGRFIPIQPDPNNPYVFKAFNLEWIELGRGNNEEIAGWIADYEGMSGYDFAEGQTSYLTDRDIEAWFEKHKRRHMNDTGDIGQYIDSRVAFLEPIKAASAIGADRQAIKVRDITMTDNHMVLKVAADNIGACGALFAGAPDIEGNLSYIKRIELDPPLQENSLCGERFVLSQNERFLPLPGTIYMTDGFGISRSRLPVFEN